MGEVVREDAPELGQGGPLRFLQDRQQDVALLRAEGENRDVTL